MTSQYWRNALLPPTATIQEAIKNLDLHGFRLVLVTNGSGKLMGTLSDGDIRRGLLRGLGLESPIEGIMFCDPFVVPPSMSRESVLQLMTTNKIQQIPVVSPDRTVIGLHLWDAVMGPPQYENTVVIMAGGKGTRLRPMTEDCPKPMLRVGGRPMLEHIIERSAQDGFTKFLIVIQYLGHMIEEHFGNGEAFGVNIDYLREDSPLGTAGGLSLMARTNAPFLVTNGDLITDVRFSDILKFHIQHNAIGTMAVRMHEWQNPFGVVDIDGVNIIGFEEKPIARARINAGVYVLSPKALDNIRVGEYCDMPELFMRLKEKSSRIVAYPMHEQWIDVGTPRDFERAAMNLSGES